MKTDKKYMMDCHLAGRIYHEADEVFNKLTVGTKLRLLRDVENRYDPNAVAVMYDDYETDNAVLIGYVPRSENDIVALLLDMGWNNIFECRICQINPEAHPERQIRLTIKIKRNKEH